MRGSIAVCALTLAAAFVVAASNARSQTTPTEADLKSLVWKGDPLGGQIHGRVMIPMPGNPDREIALPNALVFAMDRSGNRIAGAEATTSQGGYFIIERQPPGTYRICAEANGFEQSCTASPVEIRAETVMLPSPLALRSKGALMWGQITLDKAAPATRVSTAAHHTAAVAKVSALDVDGKVVAGPAFVNTDGVYAFGDVPTSARTLIASYDETNTRTPMLAPPRSNSPVRLDVTLNVVSPSVRSLTVKLENKPAISVPLGATVEVFADIQVPPGHSLHYSWSDAFGHKIGGDMASISWKLPSRPAMNYAFVEVSDDAGGAVRSSVAVATADIRAPVSPQPNTKFVPSFPNAVTKLGAAGAATIGSSGVVVANPSGSLITFNPPAHANTFQYIDPQVFEGAICSIDPKTGVKGGCEQEFKKEALRYYQAIGVFKPGPVDDPDNANLAPTEERGNFTAWKKTNGFNDNPLVRAPNETRASYYNNADLRFGRDMHCIRNPPPPSFINLFAPTACYVSNFSNVLVSQDPVAGKLPNGDPQSAISNAIRAIGPFATVAMEWNLKDVRFFVYDNDGKPAIEAALDTDGAKAVPGICMSCHGGSYNRSLGSYHDQSPTTQPSISNSNFLPFDTPSFLFTKDKTQATFSEQGQREAMRNLNIDVLMTVPKPTVMALILGWYDGCGKIFTTGCFIDDVNRPFIPAGFLCDKTPDPTTHLPPNPTDQTCGWSPLVINPTSPNSKPVKPQLSSFYEAVPRVYCRTCHVALSNFFNVQNHETWHTLSKIGVVDNVVEGSPPIMPFAEVPFLGFWKNAGAVLGFRGNQASEKKTSP